LSFGAGGVRLPWERDPRAVWERVFGSLVSGTGPGSDAERRALLRRKGLLDYLVKDATRLQARLAAPERQKLDAHLTALRDIEARLEATGPLCTKPAEPAAQTSDALSTLSRAPDNLKLML